MRQNLPVTNLEYAIAQGRTLVSKTDLKGLITYANPYFIEASGFSEAELLGAPHNLVRHPDMPPAAFRDLWETVQSGLPWTGMVKNRRKNGEFYWVEASVTPLLEGGRVTGYLSVRSKARREQIEQADRLYRSIRDGNPQRLAIRQGQVASVGVGGLAARVLNLSARARVRAALGTIAALFAGLGYAGLSLVPGAAGMGFAAVGTLGVAGIALLEFAVQRSIGLPMQEAIQTAQAIAGGDLTRRISTERRDEIGQLLRAMQQMSMNLVAMIGDVRSNVDTMAVSTGEIAAGNMDLSARTEAQASSLEQTAASLAQLALAVRQNAGNARVASGLVDEANAVAERGANAVARVGATMNDINAAGKRIENIIGLIDGIAVQTNLLALNAAVEAAKAGEQGRGFAVVAGEVRSLAQRSAAAAKEIKTLIELTVRSVEEGGRLVADAGATMDSMLSTVHQVDGIMGEMARASAEQSSGIDQINRAVAEMDKNTLQNAAMVEEAAVAAASLNDQAYRLRGAIAIFKLNPGGCASSRALRHAAAPGEAVRLLG